MRLYVNCRFVCLNAIFVMAIAHTIFITFIKKLLVINIADITLKPAATMDASKILKKLDFAFVVIKTRRSRQKSIRIFCNKKLSIYIVMQRLYNQKFDFDFEEN